MNKIDRAAVKLQAKQMIKNKVLALFVMAFIVTLLTNGFDLPNAVYSWKTSWDKTNNSQSDNFSNFFDYDNDYFEDSDDYFDFDDFYENNSGGSSEENPIDSFDLPQNQSKLPDFENNVKIGTPFRLLSIVGIFMLPLSITLYGFFAFFIKRNPADDVNLGNELPALFKNTFNSNYWKKLLLGILRTLITGLLMLLFIVPGVIFHYSSYFAYQLMCEYPHLSPMEAIKLSKKMVRDHRGELFVLDLSFILWDLLCVVTCGIAYIYVMPYVMTVQALYYENFKLRAKALGVVNDMDFAPKNYSYGYNNQGYDYRYKASQQNVYYYNPYQGQNTDTQQTSYSYAEPQGNQPNGYSYYGQSGAYTNPNVNAQPQQNNGYYYSPPKSNDTPMSENQDNNTIQ